MNVATRGRTHRSPSTTLALVTLALALACVVTLLSGCTIQVGQAQQIDPHAGGISIPVKVIHFDNGATVVLASLMINNHGPYTFIVDTGAEISLIDSQLAQRLGLRVAGSPHQGSGIGGSITETPVAVRNWHADKLRFPDTVIDSGDFSSERRSSGYVGLLGSDILSAFGLVTIDYANSTLTVYKQIAYAPVRA